MAVAVRDGSSSWEGVGFSLGSADHHRIYIVAAVILLVLLLAGFVDYYFRLPKGKSFLILGPMGAGKTALLLQLRDGTRHNGTVASMQPTAQTCQLASEKGSKASPITLIDIPGHPRVRHRFEEYAGSTRGVIFVLDSADFLSQKTDIAEQLFEVFSNAVLLKQRAPVLLACNKSDLGAKAHTIEFIRKRIEKEVEQLRSTRQSLGGPDAQADVFGLAQEAFTLQGLARSRGIRVSTATISALDGDISPVAVFIRRCLPR